MGSVKNRDQYEHDENQAEQSMEIGRVTSRQDEQTKNEQPEILEKGTRRLLQRAGVFQRAGSRTREELGADEIKQAIPDRTCWRMAISECWRV